MDARAHAGAREAEGRGGPVASSYGNRVTLLCGVRATYEALVRAIDAAHARAWLTIYAFRPDGAGAPILAALERAAERGVDVRLVVDGFGSRGIAPALRRLEEKGGSALLHPIVRHRGRLRRPDARNHKKVAVFDSKVGFVGGVNVGDQFLDWRDLHLEVHGPAVHDLERIVLSDHRDAGGRDAHERGGSTASVPAVDGRFDVISSAVPRAMHGVLCGLLEGARERIVVTTPYFVPDPAMHGALTAAARRGVSVRVLTPRRSNWPMANWAGRALYPRLLDSGVEIAEHHDAMLHAKAVVVDGKVAAVGSPNFDARSFHINGEVLCLVFDPVVVAQIEKAIDDDRSGARTVVASDFGRRSRWDRTVEASAALFARWL